MAQHDYIIANQSGAAFRADLNNGLAAIVSQNSGAAQPSTTYAYQWWADTTTGLLKLRNAANNAWITIGTLADANLGLATLASPTFTGTPAAPTATAGTNTTQVATTAFVLANAVDVTGDTMTGNLTVPSLNGGPLAGTRNRIISGDFRISQRGAGPFTTMGYGADRWLTNVSGGGSVNFGSTASGPSGFGTSGFINYVSGTVNDATFVQRIESVNCTDLVSSSQVTISFWAFTNKSGGWTPSYDLKFANSVDNFSATTAIVNGASLAAVPANTWTRLTVTATLSGSPANGLELTIHTGSMTSGENRLITGVQLEAGTVATPFERRSYGQELALCQRYYETGSTKLYIGTNNSYQYSAQVFYKVTKRAAATVVLTNTASVGFPVTGSVLDNSTQGFSELRISNATVANGDFGSTYTASIEL